MKKKLLFLFLSLLVIITLFLVTKLFSEDNLKMGRERTAVVTQIRELARFETTSFTIEKVIDAGTEYSGIREFLFGDQILLIAHGEVIAGFDLSKLKDEDFIVTNSNVTVTLPQPEILLTRLDNSQTRVYDRDQGILNPGDKDLETVAREEAEESIRLAACEAGILNEAMENGRSQLTVLLKALGFTTVVINIPSANC